MSGPPAADIRAAPAGGWPWRLALAAVVAPVLLLLAFVQRFGVNTVVADELHYVDFIRLVREHGDWGVWVWQQHNEHRVVAMKLLMAALEGPTHWSQHAEMVCSWGLTAILVAALYAIHRRDGGGASARDLFAFVPLAWLACSIAQYENQLFGMMVCHYFTVVFGVVSIWLLSERSTRWTPLASAAAVVAATSVGSGLLVFPAGIAVLAGRRADWRRWLLWCGTAIVTISLYFRHYIRPPHARPFDWGLLTTYRASKLTLLTIGAPLAGRSIGWAIALGLSICVLSAVLLIEWWREEPESRARGAAAAALLLWGLASCGMVGFGRATLLSPGDPLGSRYITHANLVWFGTTLLLLRRPMIGTWALVRPALFGIMGIGLVAANLQGFLSARDWYSDRAMDQYLLQTFERQPDSILARLGPPEIERPRLVYLKRERLSAFAQPPSLLMMLDPGKAVATGDIRQDLPVIQTVVCPVERLYDVGVMMLPAANPGNVPFVITVASNGRELARRTFDPASIREWMFVKVPLASSFECHGRTLQVSIESAAKTPGTQVYALTVQPYYEGELTQGGKPLRDHRLALALNAYRSSVLR